MQNYPRKIDRNNYTKAFLMKIISILSDHLIMSQGYGVVATILKREILEMGKGNARELKKNLEITEINQKNALSYLKIIAEALDYDVNIKDNSIAVKNCPFGIIAKNSKKKIICELCTNYCDGVTEELLGKIYKIKSDHDLDNNNVKCLFKIQKI